MSVKTRFAGAFVAGVAGVLALTAVPALAITSGPQWTVTSVSSPTNFKPGDQGDAYKVLVTNTGGESSDGSPITITDELPEGLTLDPVGASGEDQLASTSGHKLSGKLSCVFRTCTYTGKVVPDDTLTLTFPVDVSPSAPSTVTNVVRVSGGGAPAASMSTPTAISPDSAGFGISPGGATTALSTTQAGAHPDLTTSIAFNTVNLKGSLAGDPKDTVDDLPSGFAGDLIDTPSCSASVFALEECPIGTQVGVTTITIQGALTGTYTEPVYNLAPNSGEAAKIGFSVIGNFLVEAGISVRPGDYGLRTEFQNINEVATELDNVSLTIWGVPADPTHDPLRWNGRGGFGSFGISSDAPRAPFFTNSTSCGTEPLRAGFTVNSWEEPEHHITAQMSFAPIVGCDRLGIEPSLTVETTTSGAYSPTGLDLGMTIPQTYDNPDGLATSTLKRAVVTLPEGMTVNPSAGAGLGACSEAQYAQEGARFVAGRGCPNESKLGEVRIVSPSIKESITGSVYLASPAPNEEGGRNPFNALLALYLVARLPDRGIVVKAAGEVTANPLTGRLVTTFDTANLAAHEGLPPLPFSAFTFKFHSGATAPLVTPPACGSYTAQAELSPWAVPSQVLSPLIPPFAITSGVGGGACPAGGVPPFKPQVVSGAENNSAGAYSPFYLRIVRNDGEQELTKFTTIFPPGLTGNLTGIPFCPDAAIEAARQRTGQQELHEPSCPATSEIGHTLVGAGVGSVLAQTPGKVYLAGPYHGSALSIVSVTSATVGPFDLGTVVIRFALRINPTSGQVEVDSTGSDPVPHIIDGIVVHVRDIRAYIDRSKFMIDPTSCERMSISNMITGAGADPANPADQQSVSVTTPFQVADCANLKFKPKFQVFTSGKTSRTNGASLHVSLTYPKGSLGTSANIKSVKVDLPRQLPSRLETLQKACTEKQFAENPAGCPAASRVGTAVVHTPVLPEPLTGPAYFVSYGATKFPELIIVLQGYGITIDLHGETFISKKGLTSTTFRHVPDEPFESFELTLPQGPYSALANNGNLCKVKGGLKMPMSLTAQNGMVIHKTDVIRVTGCRKTKPRHKSHNKHQKQKHKKHK
jgi:uncharacterized repeat protein (TIGR01451 family)